MWGMLWLVAVFWIWIILDRVQAEAYAAWGVGSFTEAVDKEGYSRDEYSSSGIVFRFISECVDIIIGGLVSLVYFSGFFYGSTRVTTIGGVGEVGKLLAWTQVNSLYTYESRNLFFNRILSIENTQTMLQRFTETETVVLTLLVMKGVTTEEVDIEIRGIPRMSAEEIDVLAEYIGSEDVHKVSVV
jgi:hypothetical protein